MDPKDLALTLAYLYEVIKYTFFVGLTLVTVFTLLNFMAGGKRHGR